MRVYLYFSHCVLAKAESSTAVGSRALLLACTKHAEEQTEYQVSIVSGCNESKPAADYYTCTYRRTLHHRTEPACPSNFKADGHVRIVRDNSVAYYMLLSPVALVQYTLLKVCSNDKRISRLSHTSPISNQPQLLGDWRVWPVWECGIGLIVRNMMGPSETLELPLRLAKSRFELGRNFTII